MEVLAMLTLPPPSCRQKILKEKAMPMIEGFVFEEHEMIRRAATECLCNLAMSKEVRGWLRCSRRVASHAVKGFAPS
jgi:hypothetical protein